MSRPSFMKRQRELDKVAKRKAKEERKARHRAEAALEKAREEGDTPAAGEPSEGGATTETPSPSAPTEGSDGAG